MALPEECSKKVSEHNVSDLATLDWLMQRSEGKEQFRDENN